MNKQIDRLLAEIVSAAMEVSMAGIAHVFIDYSGHVHVFSVRANHRETTYSWESYVPLRIFWYDVYLLDEGAADELARALEHIRSLQRGAEWAT